MILLWVSSHFIIWIFKIISSFYNAKFYIFTNLMLINYFLSFQNHKFFIFDKSNLIIILSFLKIFIAHKTFDFQLKSFTSLFRNYCNDLFILKGLHLDTYFVFLILIFYCLAYFHYSYEISTISSIISFKSIIIISNLYSLDLWLLRFFLIVIPYN